MISMDDPRYAYTPRSDAEKRRLSMAHHRRLGNKPGHWTVYGVQVPEQHVPAVRERAAKIAAKKDYEAARRFVLRAQENGWQMRGDVWTDADIRQLGERWRAGETGAKIAKALGRSRNAILGKVNRLGLRRAPAGCSEVPVAMIREPVAGTLGIKEPDDRDPVFRAAMILVAPMFVPWTPDEIARWTGYPRKECAGVIYTMTTNGIWKGGKPDLGRYMQGDEKPGLQLGDVSLIMDAMLCTGEMLCEYGGDRWWIAPRKG